MELHNLQPAPGSVKKSKRIGRGEGSGHGGTSTKGNKGHKQRSGYKARRGNEGGQMPIQRRLPKVGFKNPTRIEYKVFNLGQINDLVESYELTEFTPESLYVVSLINRTDLIKILATGELKAKVNFKVNAASKAAIAAIQSAGNTIEII
jgi:large subunit ribosomal protein L15